MPPALAPPLTSPASRPEKVTPSAVVLVGPLPPPSGGMANQLMQLATLLREEGCSVTVVRTNASYRPSWMGSLPVIRAVGRLVPYLYRLWRDVPCGEVVHVMANSGWAWHLFAAPAIWIASWRCIPIVITYHGGEAEAFFNRSFKLIRPTLERVQQVIVPSEFLAAVFARFGVSTVQVPNVVDLDAFAPADSHPLEPHIVVTRNLEQVYDVATALHAFARVRGQVTNVRMTIAGSGPLGDELQRLTHALRIADAVRFTGRLDNRELPALYRSATVALNPSRADNMPVSVLEAMASGVAIVSTNVGGIPYLLRDGENALLVPPACPTRMAEAIERVLMDPILGRRLAATALLDIGAFSWSRVRPLLFSTYRAATAGETRRDGEADGKVQAHRAQGERR